MTDEPEKTPDEQDEFEAGIQKMDDLAEGVKVELPQELDDEFHERMRLLKEKAAGIKSVRDNALKEQARKNKSEQESARGLGIGLHVAYALIGLPLMGAAVGWFLDGRLGVDIWKGIGVVAGLVIAIAYTVMMMNRNAN